MFTVLKDTANKNIFFLPPLLHFQAKELHVENFYDAVEKGLPVRRISRFTQEKYLAVHQALPYPEVHFIQYLVMLRAFLLRASKLLSLNYRIRGSSTSSHQENIHFEKTVLREQLLAISQAVNLSATSREAH